MTDSHADPADDTRANAEEESDRFCPYCGEPGPHVTEPQVVGNLKPDNWVERTDDLRCEHCGKQAMLELEPEEHNDPDADRCVHCGSHRTFIRSDGDTGCNKCGGIMPRGEVAE